MDMGRRLGWALLPWLAYLACAGSEAADRAGAGPHGGRLEVYRGDVTERILLTGELEAEEAERLVVPNANIWPVQIRWLAEDGIEVAPGDKVVELDNSQLAARLDEMQTQEIEAEKRLASLEAQAAAEEAGAAFEVERRRAAVDKARLEAEVPDGVLAERSQEKRRLDLRKAELELAEAEAKLDSTRRAKAAEIEVQRVALERAASELASAEARLELLTLRASREGILILENHRQEGRPLQVGDAIYPGSVVGRLPDLSTLRVTARLFDVDDGRVVPGMRTVATLDAFPDLAFSGRVREVDQIADQADGSSLRRFFRVKIDLDGVDAERMRPGMSVKALVEVHHDDVLLVPRQCVDWGEAAAGPRARLADGKWAAVSLGACDAAACVMESGLQESTSLAPVAGEEG